MSGLTPEQVEQFFRDGYLILPDELSQDVVKGLMEESHNLLSGWNSTE